MFSSSWLWRREYVASQQQRWYGPNKIVALKIKILIYIKDILL